MTNIIHQIARCEDCGLEWQDRRTARKNAYAHHKKTGHQVWVETGTSLIYKRVKGNTEI